MKKWMCVCFALLLSVQAQAGFLKVVKAKYLPRSREIRVHVIHMGDCRERYLLEVRTCRESFPVQCDLDLKMLKNGRCKKLSYTILDFPIGILGPDLAYYSRGTLTIYGTSSHASLQLPEFN